MPVTVLSLTKGLQTMVAKGSWRSHYRK